MCRLPWIVIFQITVENISKDLLICRKKPAFQCTGIGVCAQPFGRRSRRATTNTVRIDDADIRVKPLFPFACKRPETIKERLCIGHFFTLTGLHLRLGPVDGVDFRPRCVQGAEEIIARSFVNVVKMVAVQIIQHRLIPTQGLFTREMAFNHRASTTLNFFTLLCTHATRFDIRIGQHWPNRRTLRFEGVDFRHAIGNGIAQLIENQLNISKLFTQLLFHLSDCRFVIDGQRVAGKGKSHNHLALTFIRN